MTCLEKLKQMHPELDDEGIKDLVEEQCPDNFGIMGMPDHCDPYVTCDKCWNREIPGSEPEPTTPVIKDSGERRQFYDADGNPMAVRDIQEGKGRCDLMPLDVVAECYHIGFGSPSDITGEIFDLLDLFTKTGDILNLYDVLAKKEPFDAFSTMFLEVAKHFEDGAKKYGENNWQKGIPVRCYIDSAVRHYLKWLRHDKDERHDRAFCWNIMCAIWTCTHKPELNCYPINATVED